MGRTETYAEKHGKIVGNYGKTKEKSCFKSENYGKTMENHGKTMTRTARIGGFEMEKCIYKW